MQQINLLKSLPATKRNIQARLEAKDLNIIAVAKQYGEQYFDGPREYGYGGYRYDGRWLPVAKDIIKHFNLKAGDRILDIGCAKGFLLKDLLTVCPGLTVVGLDISRYAISQAEPEIKDFLLLGSGDALPFENNSFSAVLSINTLHNFTKDRALIALQEIERVAKGKAFIQVDSYYTAEQKAIFESWVLTAEFHDYPEGWINLFKEAGFTGDYNWTVIN